MLIGTKPSFAIEAVPTDWDEKSVWGSFRFWINEQPAGDWEDSTSLDACFRWLADLPQDTQARTDTALYSTPLTELEDLLVVPLYGRQSKYDQAAATRAGRHDVSNVGMSSFHSWLVFVIQHEDGRARIVWRSRDASPVQDHHLEAGEFERTCADACSQFSALMSELRQASPQ